MAPGLLQKLGSKAKVAGGSFVSGGYNTTLSGDYGNALAGRQAWNGYSSGFLTTIIILPTVAAGQNVQLRWSCDAGTDCSVAFQEDEAWQLPLVGQIRRDRQEAGKEQRSVAYVHDSVNSFRSRLFTSGLDPKVSFLRNVGSPRGNFRPNP